MQLSISNSFTNIFESIYNTYQASKLKRFVILIGGCSRAGKSTLANELREAFLAKQIKAVNVSLDSWLISVDKRKSNSTVSERYDLAAVNNAVDALLGGEIVKPPLYDPITRKRLENKYSMPISIDRGILIIEGVVALSDYALLKKSNFGVFVNISSIKRLKRLIHFYKNIKNLDRVDYKKIIFEREQEEIPFITQTSLNADVIFSWSN